MLVARVELVQQIDAAALVHPRVLHAVVEAERQRRADGERRVLAPVVVGGGVSSLDAAVGHRVGAPKGPARSRSARTLARGSCRPTFRAAPWRRSRRRRRSYRATWGSSTPAATRSSAWSARWRAPRCPCRRLPAAAALRNLRRFTLSVTDASPNPRSPRRYIPPAAGPPQRRRRAMLAAGALAGPKSLPCGRAKSTAK